MTRVLLISLAIVGLLFVLLSAGVLPPPLATGAQYIVNVACSLLPFGILLLFLAPGLFHQVVDDVRHFFQRIRSRRNEIELLENKIARLGNAHHMVQLGLVYFHQGRWAKALPLFDQALGVEADSLEAMYRKGLCHFELTNYSEAETCLEQVHAAKPDYDYGLAYLRLAQTHQRLGHVQRASEAYETLLRFYPGQPEGSYQFALLKAAEGDHARAKQLMQEVVFTARHSPRFQRRRNRHWMFKARWWLWRHGAAKTESVPQRDPPK